MAKIAQNFIISQKLYVWFIWFISCFFFLFQFLIRVSPSTIISEIIQKFSITAADFGYFSAAYYAGYGLTHIPIAIMLDRYRIDIIIASSVTLVSLGLVPLIYSENWIIVIVSRFIVGAASSAAILSAFKITNLFFPKNLVSRLLGFIVCMGLLGAVLGGRYISELNLIIGWQNVIKYLIMIGLISSALLFIIQIFQILPTVEAIKSTEPDLSVIFRNRKIILFGLLASLLVGTLEGFADVWAVPFLETVYGYSKDVAASLPIFIFIGTAIGALILPWLAEKYQVYFRIIVSSGLIMIIILISLLLIRPNWIITSILFLVLGICSSYKLLVLYINSKNTVLAHSTLAAAVTNMFFMSFGFIFHSLIGRAIHAGWNGELLNNTIIYSRYSYVLGISVIVIGLIIGTIGIIYTKSKIWPQDIT